MVAKKKSKKVIAPAGPYEEPLCMHKLSFSKYPVYHEGFMYYVGVKPGLSVKERQAASHMIVKTPGPEYKDEDRQAVDSKTYKDWNDAMYALSDLWEKTNGKK